ncbi:MAG TPA: HEAT repeat domain-containing protein [Solirubrobacteraceae bacterium]|nr:HEAT repeat domain-containing protein [Solirubrobacteraceae bacterium]
MVSTNAVLIVIAIELALAGFGLLLLVGHGVGSAVVESRVAPRLARARQALTISLQSDGPVALEELQRAGRLPSRAQLSLVADLAPSLSGGQSDRLAEIAGELGIVEAAERRCGSRRWRRRLRGARLLTVLGVRSPVIAPLFEDHHPELRAQAAEWVAEQPTPDNVERLLDLLDDEHTLCRFTVKDSLLRIGSAAADPIARRLRRGERAVSPELLTVATWQAVPAMLEPALALAGANDPAVRAGAAGLLGALGGAAGAEALGTLLVDDAPQVRAAAATALGKIAHWEAAPDLAARLEDRDFDVRRAAALALRSLGPSGELQLRRSLRSPDGFAHDMARQVLDLPAGAAA